jgi:hypothetical protein
MMGKPAIGELDDDEGERHEQEDAGEMPVCRHE